ncbi:hypothetical protein GJ654_09600 [Rhodoblastus acidophilus]|uniref:DUF2336 domain-containing protein n=1 Tax=Rhodoblastus acidophilus TaxID=1074 RepID=A0A6N8DLA3_RHOAC|nr:hypothetical protein [Rhodoblastus acidophilus]MCW2274298.1 hypothetical protein [Rhodoblastus acidophilus]MTV31249.1 hypothetical protein [Rhodoblastus acidophilus]
MLSTEIGALRRDIFGKGAVTREDFARVLAVHGAGPEHADLLADVAVELIVEQADPPRYVCAKDAAWLIGAIHAHPLPYDVEIRLLTRTLERALSLPESLPRFALAEIEEAIILGRRDHPAGVIDARDVEALRQAVYATEEAASLHVTRTKAEVLFRIAHAGAPGCVDPAFDRLFAQAVGNHLMGVAHRGVLSRADRKQLEDFENSPAPSMGQFLSGMFSRLSLPTLNDLKDVGERAGERLRERDAAESAERAVAERVYPEETRWLASRLSRALTSAERALLGFLKQEMAGEPPPSLKTLFARAGV